MIRCKLQKRHTEHSFEIPGGPLVCLNAKNEPILMGMVDTGGTYETVYDRVEYALSWMDSVITGEEFRIVLKSYSQ